MRNTEAAQRHFRVIGPIGGNYNLANPGHKEVLMEVQDIKCGLQRLAGAVADIYEILARIEKKLGR